MPLSDVKSVPASDWTQAVSYTHLDVYKRQAGKGPAGHQDAAVGEYAALDVAGQAGHGLFIEQEAEVLDVYKRQCVNCGKRKK